MEEANEKVPQSEKKLMGNKTDRNITKDENNEPKRDNKKTITRQ